MVDFPTQPICFTHGCYLKEFWDGEITDHNPWGIYYACELCKRKNFPTVLPPTRWPEGAEL